MRVGRWVLVGSFVLAISATVVPAHAATRHAKRAAAPARPPKQVSLAGAMTDDNGFIPVPQSCGPSQPGLCTFQGSGMVHWTGPIQGISEYNAKFHWDPDKRVIVEENYERFTATIPGCGTGSFLTHQYKEIPPAELVAWQRPTSGKLQADKGTWNYVPGTATGDFVKLQSLWFDYDHIEFEWGTFHNHQPIDRGFATC